MAVLVDGINPFCIKAGRAPNDPVHLVTLGEKKFSQIGTILTGDASDKSALGGHLCNSTPAPKVVQFDKSKLQLPCE
jgi:hypothetical protein